MPVRWSQTGRGRLAGRAGFWIAAAILAVCALRLAYLDAGLTRDEGGDTFIALAFHHAGPFAYGAYFLDRPPLLVGLYGLASDAGGDTGTRLLGLLAACLAVTVIVLLAVRLGGRGAAPFAAVAGTAMVSSEAAGAVFTPAELLAAVPSCASVLALVSALQRPAGERRLFFAAGAAACTAVLVKQSFGDAFAAGVAALAIAGVAAHGRRDAVGAATAYAAGAAAVLAGLALWALQAGVTPHQLWYALFGFRLDAFGALASGSPETRLAHLVNPAVFSGLALGLPIAVAGLALVRSSLPIRIALGTWLLAGLTGVVLSGGYFPPYVIELMPVAAVGVAVACARRPRLGVALVLAVVAPALLPTLRAGLLDSADAYQQSSMTIGRYVRASAEPRQTAYVLYARANALYYTGLSSPFPYHWDLMMRAIPAAEHQLRALLAGPRRPTWIIEEDRPDFAGLDPGGVTRALLARHYRVVARVCGLPVLLARAAARDPATPGRCGA